jgi:uncharacterized protein (TIGR03086 family)
MLLQHACDSVAALAEGYCDGQVRLLADTAVPPADPAREFTGRAALLLARCQAGPGRDVLIGGCPMPAGQLAAIGAIEIAVHAWDVSQACGTGQPIPEPLAAALLPTAVTLISDDDRPRQFASARGVPAGANASDRLTAFLGRRKQSHPTSFSVRSQPRPPGQRADRASSDALLGGADGL